MSTKTELHHTEEQARSFKKQIDFLDFSRAHFWLTTGCFHPSLLSILRISLPFQAEEAQELVLPLTWAKAPIMAKPPAKQITPLATLALPHHEHHQ